MPATQTSDKVLTAVQALFDASALLDPARLMLWDRENLTVTQLRLLRHLDEHEGMGNAELADRLYVTRPSVSALLERLERGDFIRREVSPNDRRGIQIFLEERGRTVVASLRQELRQYVADLMEAMTDEDLDRFTEAVNTFVQSGRVRRARDLRAERGE
jgi:DNA-binding MarR family transcriptional regulator